MTPARFERLLGELIRKLHKASKFVQPSAENVSSRGRLSRRSRNLTFSGWLQGFCRSLKPLGRWVPANREINREFCRIQPSTAIFESDQRAHSIVYSRIPCTTEQGISKRVSEKILQGTGNRHADIRRPGDRALKHARRVGRCLLSFSAISARACRSCSIGSTTKPVSRPRAAASRRLRRNI
jgi:hypothetical protein